MPKPDLTQQRYISAMAAIDDTHNLARQDIVYDQWPIDDPYRDTALCVVQGIRAVGNADLNAALEELPPAGRRELIDTVSAVIELKTSDLRSYYENVGTIDSPNAIPKMTVQEQIRAIAETAHLIGHSWATRDEPDLGVEERVMGAVHGVLSMFQNGALERVPGFQLIPIDPETDEGCVNTVYRHREGQVEADWNYGESMHLTWRATPAMGPIGALMDKQSPSGSLTARFEEHYETLRRRYRTAAHDLFNTGDR
jgi:hypothetical protein